MEDELVPGCVFDAWWGTAWLRGLTPADTLFTHSRLTVDEVRLLRMSGSDQVGIALPTEGDPVGLGGPPDFNSAALHEGEALVAGGLGLVLTEGGWQAYDARPRQLVDFGEARRQLRATVISVSDAVAALDVASANTDAADGLLNLGSGIDAIGAPGTPFECVRLAFEGARAIAIVRAALADDGGALSASAAQTRRSALQPLDRAGRRALVAACSPEVWPPQ
ncbi:MAG: hypothetical protein V9G04_07295 [Nocardioides sp.]